LLACIALFDIGLLVRECLLILQKAGCPPDTSAFPDLLRGQANTAGCREDKLTWQNNYYLMAVVELYLSDNEM